MDFKNILSQLSQISEATKETGKGRVHTAEPGGYGRKDDEDSEGKKVKADAPKRGRGRPKKDAGEDGESKKYDFSAFGATGKDVKLKPWDKSKTTKHSLKEWVQEIEDKYVAEAGAPGQQLQVKPMPGASQLVDPATQKVVATGPADKIKAMQGSIAKGEVTMTGKEEMAEEGDYSAKKARAGKDIGKPGKQFGKIAKSAGERYGSKERGEKVAGAVLAKLRKTNEAEIPSSASQDTAGAGLGAGRSDRVLEAAKPDYIDLDKDGNKKESMKKAANDKKKKKVDESMDTRLKAAHLRGKAHALSKEGYNCRYDDMEEARMYHEGYKEGLDECYGQMPIVGQVVGEEDMPATVPGMADAALGSEMEEGNAFTRALAKTPAGDKFSVGGKVFTDRSGYDAKVDETMFESWDNQLNSLMEEFDTIQEGMTVSISKGQQGMPDSVSVTAQDQDADQLLQLVKSAGLGLFGGTEAPQDGQSSPMSLQPTDAGVEGSAADDIGVVDDHEGMMALIKKVTGDAGQPDVVAIGGEGPEQAANDYEEEGGEEVCPDCGSAECQCDHEEDHEEEHDDGEEQEQVDEVESEDQQAYEVAEESDDDEEEAVEESEQLEEWANEAGQNGTDQAFEADIAFMTKVIAGGLNKEKSTGQTTVPVIAGQSDRMGVNESIGDWKKLAGLK